MQGIIPFDIQLPLMAKPRNCVRNKSRVLLLPNQDLRPIVTDLWQSDFLMQCASRNITNAPYSQFEILSRNTPGGATS